MEKLGLLSVAANQIVMMVHSHGALPIDEITEAISGACQFSWSVTILYQSGKFLQMSG